MILCITAGSNGSILSLKHQQSALISPNLGPHLRWWLDTGTSNQDEPLRQECEGKVPKCSTEAGYWVQHPRGPKSPSVFEIKLPDKCVQAPKRGNNFMNIWISFNRCRCIVVGALHWRHLITLQRQCLVQIEPKLNWTSGEYPFSFLPACLFSLHLHLSWACDDDKTQVPWAVFNTNDAVCSTNAIYLLFCSLFHSVNLNWLCN